MSLDVVDQISLIYRPLEIKDEGNISHFGSGKGRYYAFGNFFVLPAINFYERSTSLFQRIKIFSNNTFHYFLTFVKPQHQVDINKLKVDNLNLLDSTGAFLLSPLISLLLAVRALAASLFHPGILFKS